MNQLWNALVLVREGKMCKHTRDDGMGGHCALGFLDVAYNTAGLARYADFVPEGKRDIEILASTMSDMFPDRMCLEFTDHHGGIVAYINNHDDTTQDDLELAFEKAAIRRDELVV